MFIYSSCPKYLKISLHGKLGDCLLFGMVYRLRIYGMVASFLSDLRWESNQQAPVLLSGPGRE